MRFRAMREAKRSRKSAEKEPAKKRVVCPFCGSTQTELYSLFGSMLSTSQYYCRSCRVAFEAIKWQR